MSNLRYKILSTVSSVGTGVILTSTSASAMFKNAFSYFSKLAKNSSTSMPSSSLTEPLTSTPAKFFYNSRGFKIPIQTSNNSYTPSFPKPSTETKSFSSKLSSTSSTTTTASSRSYGELNNMPPRITQIMNNIKSSNGGKLPSELYKKIDKINSMQSQIKILESIKEKQTSILGMLATLDNKISSKTNDFTKIKTNR